MITKISKDNEDIYKQLFRDAEAVLDVPSGSINTLDEYLLNLQDLRDIEVGRKARPDGQRENYSLRFSRLPVDEPPFAINASSRIIDIPADFKKNGIAVIGDHLAEILYFTVDRYYDTWDLLDPSIQVVAQWSYVSGGKTIRSGISIIAPDESEAGYSVRKDAKVFASDDKIMFGWPINNTIAAEAGSIKFSIRFFKIADGHLVFNMNTIPTTVEIKNGLDFVDGDGNLLENAIDDINLLEWRFRDGQGYQGGPHGADDPYYIIPLSFYDIEEKTFENAEEENPIFADLDENGKLRIGLLADGNGTDIDYKGFTVLIDANGDPVANSTSTSYPTDDFYFLTEDTEFDSAKTYYEETEDSEHPYIVTEDTEFDENKDYYEKFYGLTISGIGSYWFTITNIKKPSNEVEENEYTWSKATISSPKVNVLPPRVPEIETATSAYLDRDNKLYLTVTGSTSEPKDKITYKVGGTVCGENLPNGETQTFYIGTIAGTEEEPVNKYQESYVVSVLATRNNASSAEVSEEVTVTYPTEAPVVLVTDGNNNSTNSTGTVYAEITNMEDIAIGTLEYQWWNAMGSPDDFSNDVLIEGATESSYTPTASGIFYCVVTNTVNNLPAPGTSNRITAIVS